MSRTSEDAKVYSATAIIITAVVIIGLLLLAYFAWWVPSYQNPTVVTTPAPSPTIVNNPNPAPSSTTVITPSARCA